MTQILTANIGSYPRISEDKDHQRHRRAFQHLQNKEISMHAFRDVEQSVTQEAVREQVEAGLDEVTDGQISWLDPISHLTKGYSGFKLTRLARFYDANYYFRVPLITSKPRRKTSFLVEDFEYAQRNSHKPLRVVITGPYTMARNTQSKVKPFNKIQGRLKLFTDIIAKEVMALVARGAKRIQIDEPAIGFHPEDFLLFRSGIETLKKAMGQTRFILAVYSFPATPLFDQLSTLPIDVLNLDFTYDGKKLFEKISLKPSPVSLGLGVINARNTRHEAIDPLLKNISQWVKKTSPALFYITPSTGLEHLPRASAQSKMKLLTKLRDELLHQFFPQHTNA